MKIGIISDIHVDRNRGFPILELLAKKVTEKRLDCLLIAGDISDAQSVTLAFIDSLRDRSGRPVYFVPGNHDLWRQDGEKPADTAEIYRRYWEHPACLIGKSVPLSADWVVLGDIGWYDYSFGNKKYSAKDFEKKAMFDRTWQDSVFINWRRTDAQVHRDMLNHLDKQLLDTSGKKRIVVTHMITTDEFAVPESRKAWPYFNAFLGSRDYGDLFERYGVAYSIMGHVHYRRKILKSGVSYICSCLDYHTEWQSIDCEREIDEALTLIDL